MGTIDSLCIARSSRGKSFDLCSDADWPEVCRATADADAIINTSLH